MKKNNWKLKNRIWSKLKYLRIWAHSYLIFYIFILFPILLFLKENNRFIFLIQSTVLFLSSFIFSLLIFVPAYKINKNNFKKDYFLSIALYFGQILPTVSAIVIYTYFYVGLISTIILITTLSMFVISNCIFIIFYFNNKTLAKAILKWENTYPIIRRKLINEYNS